MYKAVSKGNGKEYAVKMLPLNRQDIQKRENEEMIKREICHMRKLRKSPYVVKLEDICYDAENNVVLVEELCNGPHLQHVLAHNKLTEVESGRIICDVIKAISDCHNNKILFCDLKPANIIYSTQDKRFKLTDFGSSIRLDGQMIAHLPYNFATTPTFAAPEMIDRTLGNVTPASDVWAIGVLAYWLLFKSHPFLDFYANHNQNVVDNVLTRDPTYDIYPVSPDAINFVKSILLKNPKKRIDVVEDLIEHPFIKKCQHSNIQI